MTCFISGLSETSLDIWQYYLFFKKDKDWSPYQRVIVNKILKVLCKRYRNIRNSTMPFTLNFLKKYIPATHIKRIWKMSFKFRCYNWIYIYIYVYRYIIEGESYLYLLTFCRTFVTFCICYCHLTLSSLFVSPFNVHCCVQLSIIKLLNVYNIFRNTWGSWPFFI